MSHNVEAEVRTLMSEVLGVNTDVLTDELTIGDIPQWDSLRHMQLIQKLESHYGFRFTPSEMVEMSEVADVIAAVATRIGS